MHTDALGSPVAYTNSTGSVLAGRRTQYEPYGTPTTTPRNGEPSYTGHQYDQTTGLIYAQARFYDPTLGRFLSPDPMAVDTTSAFNFNRYAYANNSPYRFTDPDGRDAADRAYGAAVGFMLRNDPERLAIWAAGEAAATTEGSAAEAGAGMGLAIGEFVDKGDFSKQAVATVAVKAMVVAFTKGKSRTAPTLPNKTIASSKGVSIEHYYKSGDHGPAHAHVDGGGASTKIGPNGKPIAGSAPLSAAQQIVVSENKSSIRSAINKIGRWLAHNEKSE